jgi:hypothetical protein
MRREVRALSRYDIRRLRKLCERFRSAIMTMPKNELPIGMHAFPLGACGDAALILALFLRDCGFDRAEYVAGWREQHSHAWLQVGDLVIDVTADQFPDAPRAVIVATRSDWHRAFTNCKSHPADLCGYDEETQTMLSSAYTAIFSRLDSRGTVQSSARMAQKGKGKL